MWLAVGTAIAKDSDFNFIQVLLGFSNSLESKVEYVTNSYNEANSRYNVDRVRSYSTRAIGRWLSTSNLTVVATNKNAKTLLLIHTRTDGKCENCNNLETRANTGRLQKLSEQYGMAIFVGDGNNHTNYMFGKAIGLNWSVIPMVTLVWNPQSAKNNTMEWYKDNQIFSAGGGSFGSTQRADAFCQTKSIGSLEWYLMRATNRVEKTTASETSQTVVITNTPTMLATCVTITSNPYAIEGRVLPIEFSRSGDTTERLGLHVFCDDVYVDDVVWEAGTSGRKTIECAIPQRDNFDGIRSSRTITVKTISQGTYIR